MKGFVQVQCSACHELIRVNVDFPSDNQGFEPISSVCPLCGVSLLIADPHVYSREGIVQKSVNTVILCMSPEEFRSLYYGIHNNNTHLIRHSVKQKLSRLAQKNGVRKANGDKFWKEVNNDGCSKDSN